MIRIKTIRFVMIPLWMTLGISFLAAEVRLPAIFGSHMVLQQGKPIPVWGWAGKGERVTVTLARQSRETVADEKGNWKVELEALSAGGPHTLTIRGSNEIKLDDVLIGEVWVCSGQSNMEWGRSPAARVCDRRERAKIRLGECTDSRQGQGRSLE